MCIAFLYYVRKCWVAAVPYQFTPLAFKHIKESKYSSFTVQIKVRVPLDPLLKLYITALNYERRAQLCVITCSPLMAVNVSAFI